MDQYQLQHKIETLVDEFDNPSDPELAKLLNENKKLKYRLLHINESIKKEQEKLLEKITVSSSNIASPIQIVRIAFNLAIKKSFPESSHEALVDVHKDENKWDYYCNSAFALSKIAKSNPKMIAEQLMESLPVEFKNLTDNIEIAGPGFINIKFKIEFYRNRAIEVIHSKLGSPKELSSKSGPSASKKPRLLIDYSSPNIAKDMHVGHLRSTIIGDTIANLFEYLGYDVLRLNHIGDWGTQFGMLIAHLQDVFPDYDKKTPTITDLTAFYKKSKERFDNDEDFKKRAYENVGRLQAYEEEIFRAWKAICAASSENYTAIYKELNISTELTERGESFYNEKMNSMMAEMKAKKQMSCDPEDGRHIYFPKDCPIPLILIKSDGAYTYDTSDLACIKQRVQEENSDVILYVTDAGQATHFNVVFAAARELGIYNEKDVRVEHVPFGVVLGQDKKKFKTRSGETVSLKDLLNEGRERVSNLMKENQKGKDIQMSDEEFKTTVNAIAMSSIKYSDLSSNRDKAYIFNYDKMLSFQGNTGAYLLYAYTRIRSIAKKVNHTSDQIRSEKFVQQFEAEGSLLKNAEERKLIKKITQWYDKISIVEKDLCPHHLCSWLYELARAFTEFYDKHYVRENLNGEEKIHLDRLFLCEITAVAFERAFGVLGFLTVDKM